MPSWLLSSVVRRLRRVLQTRLGIACSACGATALLFLYLRWRAYYDKRLSFLMNVWHFVVSHTGSVVISRTFLSSPMPSSAQLSVARRLYDVAMQAYVARVNVDTVDVRLPVESGEISARLYTPLAEDKQSTGLVLYFHGGGWTFGSVDGYDNCCRFLTKSTGCCVLSVDYRLAPECKFPTAANDAIAAARWACDEANALAFGYDAWRVAVMGDSAGGNLAAIVAQHMRERICKQVLVYPVTHGSMGYSSWQENDNGILSAQCMGQFYNMYLRCAQDTSSPLLSPILTPVEELKGVAPALIITAECDILRDEGEAYGRVLQSAGVEVETRRFPGAMHTFFSHRLQQGGMKAARLAHQHIRDAMK